MGAGGGRHGAVIGRLPRGLGNARTVVLALSGDGRAQMAARDHQVEVTGLTLSPEQKAFAERRLAESGKAWATRTATGASDAAGRMPGEATR